MKGDRDRLKMPLFYSFLRGKLRDGSLGQQNLDQNIVKLLEELTQLS